MKEVYSYQEIGHTIDTGQQVVFTCHPEARVTVVQKDTDSDTITVTIILSIGDTCIGIIENAYLTIGLLLDAFDINDLSEIWEVLV